MKTSVFYPSMLLKQVIFLGIYKQKCVASTQLPSCWGIRVGFFCQTAKKRKILLDVRLGLGPKSGKECKKRMN